MNLDTIARFLIIPYNAILLAGFIISGIVLFWPSNRKYSIKASELTQRPAQKLTIIDIRDNPTLRIPKSKLLNLKQLSINNQIHKQLKNKEEAIILVGENRSQAIENLKILKKLHYKNVLILDNGIDGWKNAGLPLSEKI